MIRPPEDNGILWMMGDADKGKGFLRTGDGALTRDVWAWKAEKDGTSMDGVANGFVRADEEKVK